MGNNISGGLLFILLIFIDLSKILLKHYNYEKIIFLFVGSAFGIYVMR